MRVAYSPTLGYAKHVDPEIAAATALAAKHLQDLGAVVEQVEIQIKYAGYIARQQEDVLRQERYEELKLPQAMDYLAVRGLSIEVGQKLNKHRPETLGQASRISGVTPAALSLLLVHLKRGDWRGLDLDHAEPKAPDFETSKSRAA